MYTRYKFLMLFVFGMASSLGTMFLIAIETDKTAQLFWICAWCVSVGLAIFGVNGYADSKAQSELNHATGMHLDHIARTWNMKRRFAGWEFDSKFRDRLERHVAQCSGFKKVTFYDRAP